MIWYVKLKPVPVYWGGHILLSPARNLITPHVIAKSCRVPTRSIARSYKAPALRAAKVPSSLKHLKLMPGVSKFARESSSGFSRRYTGLCRKWRCRGCQGWKLRCGGGGGRGVVVYMSPAWRERGGGGGQSLGVPHQSFFRILSGTLKHLDEYETRDLLG